MIAFDIDGCMNNIKEDIIRLGKDYFKDYNVGFNAAGYYIKDIYPGASDKVYEMFWERFGYEIYTNSPKHGVRETISFLRENNIQSCIITSRNPQREFSGVNLRNITTIWLKKNNIELPVYHTKNKSLLAASLNVKLMIEDKPANILSLQRITKVLIYQHPYNSFLNGIFVENWDDIKNYIQSKIFHY